MSSTSTNPVQNKVVNTELGKKLALTGDAKDNVVTFSQASSRANIASGEKFSVILGKISKFFADLKTVAFSGSYSDLSNKPTIPAAVAVKGNAESSYRTGNVNLTPANIGAVSTTGDTANNTVAFTSADSTTATAWTDVSVLATGEKHSSILNKVSTMFKNIRFLYKMLGTTDISAIGDGTVTNALSTLNSNLENMPLHMQLVYRTNFNDETVKFNIDMSKYVKDWQVVPVLVIISRSQAVRMYYASCLKNQNIQLAKIIEVGTNQFDLDSIDISSIDYTYSDNILSINFAESKTIYRAINVFALG